MENICLICGFNELYEPPYDEEGEPSDEICPCCSFHFGYDNFDDQEKKLYMNSGGMNGYEMEVNGFQIAGNLLKIGMRSSDWKELIIYNTV
ncbi:hypothetical protein ACIQ7N_03070 [Lysinibacillus sp. NPDC095746]|uniref:hypothetical protein n=1 Tax=Lysinibacillus sp. NPDC095746 TaxID=3364134 RepID=UPI0037FB005F